MGRGAVERAGLGEERVDAAGPAAFEVVAAERRGFEDRGDLVAGPGEGVGLEHALDDGVPVVGEPAADRVGIGGGS